MVLVIATGHGSTSANIARAADIKIPHVGNFAGTLSVVRAVLPPMPLFLAAEDQLTSDTTETFDIPNCSSFTELAVRLSDLRHADTSRVVQCYATGESEFEVCTFANDIILSATFAAMLNLPVLLEKTVTGHPSMVTTCERVMRYKYMSTETCMVQYRTGNTPQLLHSFHVVNNRMESSSSLVNTLNCSAWLRRSSNTTGRSSITP